MTRSLLVGFKRSKVFQSRFGNWLILRIESQYNIALKSKDWLHFQIVIFAFLQGVRIPALRESFGNFWITSERVIINEIFGEIWGLHWRVPVKSRGSTRRKKDGQGLSHGAVGQKKKISKKGGERMVMGAKEVYEKYKHMDKLLSDSVMRDFLDGEKDEQGQVSALKQHMLYDFWQVIKDIQKRG